MVPLRPTLASAFLLLAGCAQIPQASTPPESFGPAGEQHSRVARSSVSRVFVYGDSALRPAALADALRAGLTARGFDVRGAEANAPAGDGNAATRVTRTVIEGNDPPTNVRTLAYLFPNAPRIILLVEIDTVDLPDRTKDRAVRLGAVFADTLDGAILWSSRLEEKLPSDDRELRRLADRLLATLPPPQS